MPRGIWHIMFLPHFSDRYVYSMAPILSLFGRFVLEKLVEGFLAVGTGRTALQNSQNTIFTFLKALRLTGLTHPKAWYRSRKVIHLLLSFLIVRTNLV